MRNHDLYLKVGRDGVVSRRAVLRAGGAGLAGASMHGWMSALRGGTDELRRQGLACILLFMQGGPSQFETFDPKPGASTGGPTKAIATAVPGIRIAEGWGKVAGQMKDITLVRSMTGREGNHQRAQYLLHTGYAPTGSVKYPGLGSVAASELGDPAFDLPGYVCIGGSTAAGPGSLGMKYAPYLVGDPTQMPLNATLPRGVSAADLKRRLGLMGKLEEDLAGAGARPLVESHRAVTDTAARMVLSARLQAFDLGKEQDALRDRYGRTPFGQGCLLARRLVETGVTFVEVVSGGWDTHQDNFNATQRLAGAVDPGFATLVADLRDRGMLGRTLVIWMGEFGRTPRINGRTGRDHYPRAFSLALAGAGVKGGQVLGATDDDGTDVKDRPVSVADLFCTFCHALKMNPRKVNIAAGRPIRIVEGGAAVTELF